MYFDKEKELAIQYVLKLNLCLGVYNVAILFLFFEDIFAFIIGMLNIGVWLFFRK